MAGARGQGVPESFETSTAADAVWGTPRTGVAQRAAARRHQRWGHTKKMNNRVFIPLFAHNLRPSEPCVPAMHLTGNGAWNRRLHAPVAHGGVSTHGPDVPHRDGGVTQRVQAFAANIENAACDGNVVLGPGHARALHWIPTQWAARGGGDLRFKLWITARQPSGT